MKKKLLGILFALVLCALVFPAAGMAESVKYIDENGKEQTCANATVVTSSDTSWNAGWYVVDTSATITGQVTLAGDVHLILKDGCTLTVTNGIISTTDNVLQRKYNLTIYQESKSESESERKIGALDVTVTDTDRSGIEVNDLTVNGGTIKKAYADNDNFDGIKCEGNFTMNGGTITKASEKGTGNGINCLGDFTMNGGTITKATGNTLYGIFCKKTFTMSGGTLTADSSKAAGIYCVSAFNMQDGTLTVNADGKSEDDITGISCSTFTMSGGTITATAKNTGSGAAYGISCGSEFKFDPEGIMKGEIHATFKGSQAAVQLSFTNLYDFSAANPYLDAKASAEYTGDMTKIDDLAELKAGASGTTGVYFLSTDKIGVLKQLSLTPKTTEPEPENPQSGSNNPATGIVSANAALPAVVVLTVLAVSLTALLVINRKKNC